MRNSRPIPLVHLYAFAFPQGNRLRIAVDTWGDKRNDPRVTVLSIGKMEYLDKNPKNALIIKNSRC